jgi:dTDP-4-dehydrorhamnose 3,5-epimerase
MSVTPTIDGLTVTPLRVIADERGAVLHMLRADAPEFTSFGECYLSEVKPGVEKAWKRHSRQVQNLAVPAGRVRFVVYDARDSSPTQGAVDVIELGRPDAYVRLCIPRLLWYGFKCVSDTPALVLNCADIPHDPAEAEMIGIHELARSEAVELLRRGSASP